MAFMMNACGNTKMQIHGKCSLIYSITFHSQPLCKDKYLAPMEDCPPISQLLMISGNSIEFKKYLMKVPFVTCFGVIQMKGSDLTSVQEVQDGLLVR